MNEEIKNVITAARVIDKFYSKFEEMKKIQSDEIYTNILHEGEMMEIAGIFEGHLLIRSKAIVTSQLGKKSEDQDENKICRICLHESEKENPLLRPCKCKGSIGFAHEACLKIWILDYNHRICEMCSHKYSLDYSICSRIHVRPYVPYVSYADITKSPLSCFIHWFYNNIRVQIALKLKKACCKLSYISWWMDIIWFVLLVCQIINIKNFNFSMQFSILFFFCRIIWNIFFLTSLICKILLCFYEKFKHLSEKYLHYLIENEI